MVSRVMIWNKTFERFNGNLYPVGKSIISSQYSTVWAESITLDITVREASFPIWPPGGDQQSSLPEVIGLEMANGQGRGGDDFSVISSTFSTDSIFSSVSITSGTGGLRNTQLTMPKHSIMRIRFLL
jgi:hypothetical protein